MTDEEALKQLNSTHHDSHRDYEALVVAARALREKVERAKAAAQKPFKEWICRVAVQRGDSPALANRAAFEAAIDNELAGCRSKIMADADAMIQQAPNRPSLKELLKHMDDSASTAFGGDCERLGGDCERLDRHIADILRALDEKVVPWLRNLCVTEKPRFVDEARLMLRALGEDVA